MRSAPLARPARDRAEHRLAEPLPALGGKRQHISQSLKTHLKRLKLSGLLPTLPDRVAYARKTKLPELEFLELVLQDALDKGIERGSCSRAPGSSATSGAAGSGSGISTRRAYASLSREVSQRWDEALERLAAFVEE